MYITVWCNLYQPVRYTCQILFYQPFRCYLNYSTETIRYHIEWSRAMHDFERKL